MKRYSMLKPAKSGGGLIPDLNILYTAEEASALINDAYWSTDPRWRDVPKFLEVETDAPEAPSLQSYLLSVSDE